MRSRGLRARGRSDDEYTTDFNVKLTVPVETGVLANDTGPAGAHVSIDDSDSTSLWGNADINIKTNGSFTYTPDPLFPFSGIDSFDYVVVTAADETMATAYITVNAYRARRHVLHAGQQGPHEVGARRLGKR